MHFARLSQMWSHLGNTTSTGSFTGSLVIFVRCYLDKVKVIKDPVSQTFGRLHSMQAGGDFFFTFCATRVYEYH